MNIHITGAIRDEQDKTVAIADEYVQELGTNLKERLDGQRVEDVLTVIRELTDAADKHFGGRTGEGAYEFHQLLRLAEQNPTAVLHVM